MRGFNSYKDLLNRWTPSNTNTDIPRVSVDDNGRGFDPNVVQQGASLGLKLIRERAEMLGGNFEMDSAVGKGARIAFAVPARS